MMNKFKEFFRDAYNAGYTHIVLRYSGSGDDGNIDDAELVKISDSGKEETKITPEIDSLFEKDYREELTDLIYEHSLEEEYSGWENGSGAYGEIKLDLVTGQIHLEHNEVIETSQLNESEYNFYKLLKKRHEKV